MEKSIILTNEQLQRFKGKVLKESFVVNKALVLKIKNFLDPRFKPITYDDIDDEGFVVPKVAIEMLDTNGGTIQRINFEKLLDKIDQLYKKYIKDDKERKEFLSQVIKYWAKGQISKDGLLPVNSTGK